MEQLKPYLVFLEGKCFRVDLPPAKMYDKNLPLEVSLSIWDQQLEINSLALSQKVRVMNPEVFSKRYKEYREGLLIPLPENIACERDGGAYVLRLISQHDNAKQLDQKNHMKKPHTKTYLVMIDSLCYKVEMPPAVAYDSNMTHAELVHAWQEYLKNYTTALEKKVRVQGWEWQTLRSFVDKINEAKIMDGVFIPYPDIEAKKEEEEKPLHIITNLLQHTFYVRLLSDTVQGDFLIDNVGVMHHDVLRAFGAGVPFEFELVGYSAVNLAATEKGLRCSIVKNRTESNARHRTVITVNEGFKVVTDCFMHGTVIEGVYGEEPKKEGALSQEVIEKVLKRLKAERKEAFENITKYMDNVLKYDNEIELLTEHWSSLEKKKVTL